MLVYEYKLKTKLPQQTAIDEAIRTGQFIRNKCIRHWMDTPKVGKSEISEQSKILAQEFDFAKRLNSQARQAACERAWSSIARFYDNCKKNKPGQKGYPKFKKNVRSVEYKASGWQLSPDCKNLIITDKTGIGNMKLVGNQILNPYRDKIKRVRLIKRADGYYAQFCMAIDRIEEVSPTGSAIGIDFNLKNLYTDSNGESLPCPKFLRKAEQQIRRLQRRLSKKKKKSQNRKKSRQKLAKKHLKVSRQRKDFAVKLARALFSSHDLIVIENLQVKNMVKNHCLAKSISDAAWAMIRIKLEYFAKVLKKVLVIVPAHYTSQECSACGTLVPKTLAERIHRCECGLVLDRDMNAALVILKRGLEKIGTGGHPGTASQEEKPEDRSISGVFLATDSTKLAG